MIDPSDIDLSTWNQLLSAAQEPRLAATFKLFRTAGIEPILIKGWAAARYYPNSISRRPGDIDLAVDPVDFKKSCEVLERARLNYLVDLHDGLRALDSLPWNELFSNSQLVALNETAIRVLRPEDHLRVLCTHWLLDGGGYKDKLWDIYYAVDRRPSNFDWQRCLDVVKPHRRGWVICAIALAHHFLKLNVDDLPFAAETKQLPHWITRCVETEWRYPERLEPILTLTHDTRLLFHQVVRRIPPNPIRATIEGEGDLYGPARWWYQFAVLGRRTGPFFRDAASMLYRNVRNRS